MANLKVNIAGVEFKNPIITASGSYGFGREYNKVFPIEKLGGISCKGTTLQERLGNPPPRVAETSSGMLNSVGLQNPGVEHFIKEDLVWLSQKNIVKIANIAGRTYDEYCCAVEKLNDTNVDMIELNISCPNVREGGVSFGTSPKGVEEIVSRVRKVCNKPLIVKLTPNVTDISEIAAAAESAGADSISLINTLTGMRIDINNRRPILKNNTGGLSGPAIFPVALRMVWQVANTVKIPVIGMGGISKWQDAVEMLLAGASAVQIGTANFTDAFTPVKVIEGLEKYLDDNSIKNVNEIVGEVVAW
ncbi:MAG TPA: dihydroorotate dehydrogenase [Clostridia bacterium]|nr:dihydroorotate dehydrogenase [Clostridia bacterium]